ncbi:tryptophan synthase alpha chain [Anseongella ginsenosidimutans]|uniref:Tryptophan synthase alpha chain n=1 Tax=Anseongella ginsenosidimutans TaxID=496056 RepID=A0A4R3KSR9_9SPHI|nr:tryptophan synthase subunit alpha [Anseongella ginsenosidimutans]QEC53213.1 tryptophan synthase subunit alpha [Anseongella ginsenosidimutans]TCS87846.1 tryptophan synthase alpha chain [Anseongella ginsenosidimutans]
MNRITELFKKKSGPVLSIYYTAGYPGLNDTLLIAKSLEEAGADMLEIGFPFSDPLADGPVIQHSSEVALKNGMSLRALFGQLKALREEVNIPVLLMGYLNPVIQYGMEKFCASCEECGIDGLILPDLPMAEYEETYQELFRSHHLSNIFLVTPESSEERIRKIDGLSEGFVYALSSSSTTGKNMASSDRTEAYFEKLRSLELRNPLMIGFGVSDRESFQKVVSYARGAIIGSAFIRLLEKEGAGAEAIHGFVRSVLGR